MARMWLARARRVAFDVILLWLLQQCSRQLPWSRLLRYVWPFRRRVWGSTTELGSSKEGLAMVENQFAIIPCAGTSDSKIISPKPAETLRMKSADLLDKLPNLNLEFPEPGTLSRQVSVCSEDAADADLLRQHARIGDHKLVLVLVGLPARGKSCITRHLQRYLSFDGFGVQVFNVGNHRRKVLGAGQGADFFDPGNKSGQALRQQVAFACFDDLLGWLTSNADAHVGIFDATNSTAERRAALLRRCEDIAGIRVAFLESICTDQAVLQKNYEMKLKNNDYKDWDPDAARKDFMERTAKYEAQYETIEESEDAGQISFMKILNCGAKTVQRHCEGFLVSKVGGYLLNMHIQERVIFLTRHGESEDNAAGRLGGDSLLTKAGMEYANRLRDFMWERLGFDKPASLWDMLCQEEEEKRPGWLLVTSQMRRTRQTARPLLADADFIAKSGMRRVHTALLNEISAGVYDGYTAAKLQKEAPDEFQARLSDKLRYRYPKGESYLDLVQRIRPVLMEIEQERRPVLMIAHQAVLRLVLAFFQGTCLEQAPDLVVPLHTVLQLRISAHGCEVQQVPLGFGSHRFRSTEDVAGLDCDIRQSSGAST